MSELRLTLPGEWWPLPLRADDARARIREFAERRYGTADDRTGMRVRMRRQLQEVVERAERGRAAHVHLGVSIAEGVPMPALVTVYRPLPVGTARDASGAAVMAALVPLLQRAEHEDAGGSADVAFAGPDDRVFEVGERRVLRKPRLRWNADAVGELPSLSIDYWITVPRARQAVLLHVDVPETPMSSMLVPLFDEIAFASTFARAAWAEEAVGSGA